MQMCEPASRAVIKGSRKPLYCTITIRNLLKKMGKKNSLHYFLIMTVTFTSSPLQTGPASAAGSNGAHLGENLSALVQLDKVCPRSSNKRDERLSRGSAEEACKGQEALTQSLLKSTRPSAEHSSAATLRQSRKRDPNLFGDSDADGTFDRELERRVRDVVADVWDAFRHPVPKK